jgi:hypothetical protein
MSTLISTARTALEQTLTAFPYCNVRLWTPAAVLSNLPVNNSNFQNVSNQLSEAGTTWCKKHRDFADVVSTMFT